MSSALSQGWPERRVSSQGAVVVKREEDPNPSLFGSTGVVAALFIAHLELYVAQRRGMETAATIELFFNRVMESATTSQEPQSQMNFVSRL